MYLSESTFGSGIKEFPQIMLQEKCTQSEKKNKPQNTQETPSRGISQIRNHISSASLKTQRETH